MTSPDPHAIAVELTDRVREQAGEDDMLWLSMLMGRVQEPIDTLSLTEARDKTDEWRGTVDQLIGAAFELVHRTAPRPVDEQTLAEPVESTVRRLLELRLGLNGKEMAHATTFAGIPMNELLQQVSDVGAAKEYVRLLRDFSDRVSEQIARCRDEIPNASGRTPDYLRLWVLGFHYGLDAIEEQLKALKLIGPLRIRSDKQYDRDVPRERVLSALTALDTMQRHAWDEDATLRELVTAVALHQAWHKRDHMLSTTWARLLDQQDPRVLEELVGHEVVISTMPTDVDQIIAREVGPDAPVTEPPEPEASLQGLYLTVADEAVRHLRGPNGKPALQLVHLVMPRPEQLRDRGIMAKTMATAGTLASAMEGIARVIRPQLPQLAKCTPPDGRPAEPGEQIVQEAVYVEAASRILESLTRAGLEPGRAIPPSGVLSRGWGSAHWLHRKLIRGLDATVQLQDETVRTSDKPAARTAAAAMQARLTQLRTALATDAPKRGETAEEYGDRMLRGNTAITHLQNIVLQVRQRGALLEPLVTPPANPELRAFRSAARTRMGMDVAVQEMLENELEGPAKAGHPPDPTDVIVKASSAVGDGRVAREFRDTVGRSYVATANSEPFGEVCRYVLPDDVQPDRLVHLSPSTAGLAIEAAVQYYDRSGRAAHSVTRDERPVSGDERDALDHANAAVDKARQELEDRGLGPGGPQQQRPVGPRPPDTQLGGPGGAPKPGPPDAQVSLRGDMTAGVPTSTSTRRHGVDNTGVRRDRGRNPPQGRRAPSGRSPAKQPAHRDVTPHVADLGSPTPPGRTLRTPHDLGLTRQITKREAKS